MKCFLLVAENLSFARAAECLYISQPAVTKQISALERELGMPLFLRSTRHVELTPAGMAFYPDAKDIVLKAEAAVRKLHLQQKDQRTLRLGVSNALVLPWLTPVLAYLHRRHPEFVSNLEVLDYKTLQALFQENKLDAIFLYRENGLVKGDVRFRALEEDRLVCLMPESHRLSGAAGLTLEDLAAETILACSPLNAPRVTAAFQKKMMQAHPERGILYCATPEAAHCLAAAGVGIAVLPALLCAKEKGLVTVPLQEKRPLTFGVFYHKEREAQLLEALMEAL